MKIRKFSKHIRMLKAFYVTHCHKHSYSVWMRYRGCFRYVRILLECTISREWTERETSEALSNPITMNLCALFFHESNYIISRMYVGRGRTRDGLIPRRNIEKRIHMNDQLCDQRGHLSNRITRLRSFRPSVACTGNGQPSFKRKSLALQFHILADIIYVHFTYSTFKHFWPHCWPTSLPMNESRLFSHWVALAQVFMYVSNRISETSG